MSKQTDQTIKNLDNQIIPLLIEIEQNYGRYTNERRTHEDYSKIFAELLCKLNYIITTEAERRVKEDRESLINKAKTQINEFSLVAAMPDNDDFIKGWNECIKYLEDQQQEVGE